MNEEFLKVWKRWKEKLLKKDKDIDLGLAKRLFLAGWKAREFVAKKLLDELLKNEEKENDV